MIIEVPFIFEVNESEFEKIFISEFLDEKICYENIPVIFSMRDFSHICYEKGKEGIEKEKFGIRRARRLLVLKQILLKKIPSELRFEPSTGNYCLLCEELDFIIFLHPNPKDKELIIGTIIHFGEGFSKAIEKSRNMSTPTSKITFNEK